MSGDKESEKNVAPRKIGVMDQLRADPGFPVTVISTLMNFSLAHMFFSGITGNPRAGLFAGLVTVPLSAITNILDTERDYKAWKETASMRARGLPEILFHKKVLYDWEYYEPLRLEIDDFYNRNTNEKQQN